jgi:hypothetical protein
MTCLTTRKAWRSRWYGGVNNAQAECEHGSHHTRSIVEENNPLTAKRSWLVYVHSSFPMPSSCVERSQPTLRPTEEEGKEDDPNISRLAVSVSCLTCDNCMWRRLFLSSHQRLLPCDRANYSILVVLRLVGSWGERGRGERGEGRGKRAEGLKLPHQEVGAGSITQQGNKPQQTNNCWTWLLLQVIVLYSNVDDAKLVRSCTSRYKSKDQRGDGPSSQS